MLTIKIDKNNLEIDGSAPEPEIIATCTCLLSGLYDNIYGEILTFKEFLEIFQNTAIKVKNDIMKEENTDDYTCISIGSIGKLS